MAVLSEFNSAAQLREIIRGYAAEVVDEERPPTRYAIVTAVHPTLRVATVRYPDEVATFTIPYGSAQPVVTHTVRVAGKQGARYIEDVLHTGTSDADSVPSGQKIYHRIAGNNILTIQNPNDPATTATFGGYVMEMHPGYGGGYLTLHPAHYATLGYVLLNDTSNTFLSANTGGTVYIRAGANDSAHQIAVSSTSVAVSGNFSSNDGVVYTNSTGLGTTGVVNAGNWIQSASYVRAEGSYLSSDTDTHTRNYGKTGHRIRIGAWAPDTGWTCYIGNCGYMLFDHVSTTANAHVRAYSTLRIGGSSNDQLVMNGDGVSCSTVFSAASTITSSGPFISNWTSNSQGHTTMLFQGRSPGLNTGYSSWLTGYGIAPTMSVHYNVGEMFDFINNAGSGYNWVGAADFRIKSSRNHKVNVRTATTEHRDRTYEAFRRTRTVVFDDEVGELHIGANERFGNINKRWQAKGHSPLTLTEDHIVVEDHDCSKSTRCHGTAGEPCGVYSAHKDRRGFIAEELAMTMPQAVMFDIENEPNAISYAVLVTELWDVVGHLADRVEALEAQLAEATASGTPQ